MFAVHPNNVACLHKDTLHYQPKNSLLVFAVTEFYFSDVRYFEGRRDKRVLREVATRIDVR